MKKAIWVGLMLSLLGLVSVSRVRGDEWNKKTVLTFSQPVEIPGQVLPAGTYVFKLADSLSDRHIVQIFNADESQILATVLVVPDYRLTPTDQTLIRFGEVPAGMPEVIRAWFYPGNTVGHEFVYPRARATQLAKAANAVVPAMPVEAADLDAMKTAPIMAITPDEQEVPITAAIQTAPPEQVANVERFSNAASPVARQTGWSAGPTAAQLPKTASALPLILLLGLLSVGVAFGLMAFGKYTAGSDA